MQKSQSHFGILAGIIVAFIHVYFSKGSLAFIGVLIGIVINSYLLESTVFVIGRETSRAVAWNTRAGWSW